MRTRRRGGGVRAVSSIAYSLALLAYTMENAHRATLPPFIMIDSPGKNFGASNEAELAMLRCVAG